MPQPTPDGLPPTVDVPRTPPPAATTAGDPRPDARETASYLDPQVTQAHAPGGAAPADERGKRPSVPGYEIEGVLGRGGMGVVYKARHVALKRPVALKMILAGAHAGEVERVRFKLETEAVARLQHPNIVQVYEVGEHDGLPYCALEFVDGGSLAQKVGGKAQSPREAARLVEALAEAMHLAHSRNVVHRDLKPANVLLTAGGVPKVTDFGLAKQLDADSGQTRSGAIMGTPAYMAPEQAGGMAQQAGPAADIYALGAILYECLTGRPPFSGTTLLELLEKVRGHEPMPPRRVQAKTPRDLETICLKCLRKEPEKRYASAKELAEDLRRFQSGEPIRARSVGVVERVVKWAKRRPAIAALLALVVVVTVAGLVAVVSQWRRAEANAEGQRTARIKADDAKADAQAKEILATIAQGEERKAKNLAVAEQHKSERTAGLQSLAAARFALADNDLLRADEALDGCPPGERGWAWRHLKYRGQADLLPWALNTLNPTRVAFSPDGRTLAVVSNGPEITLWDIVTCHLLLTLSAAPEEVRDLAFSPDGKRLAAARADRGDQAGRVAVWDPVAGGKPVLELRGHGGGVRGLAYSPDGKRLASAGADKTIKVWDAADGTEILTLTGHTDRVNCVAYSPDGRQLLSGGADRTVRVWDALGGRLLGTNVNPAGAVTSVAFRPGAPERGGGQYAAADEAGLVTLSTESAPLRGHTESITRLTFSPDGRALVTSSLDRTARVWDVENGLEAFRVLGHTEAVRDVAFSADGQLLVTAGGDHTVKLWDAWAGQSARVLAAFQWGVTAAAYRADGRAVALGVKDGTAAVIDSQTGVVLFRTRAQAGQVTGVSFSSDGAWLATAGFDGEFKVWDLASGKVRYARRLAVSGYINVAFSPTEPLLATTDFEGVRFWDSEKGEVLRTISEKGLGLGLAFSPDGKRLALHSNLRLKVFEAASGKSLLDVAGLGMPIESIAWRPDGSQIAVNLVPGQGFFEGVEGFGHKGVVRAWDVTTGQEVYTLRSAGQRAAYTADGRQLVSVGFDEARFWDAESGQEAFTLPVASRGVDVVAFSPDGEQMLLATSNHHLDPKQWSSIPGVVRVYAAPRRQPATTLRRHNGPVAALTFTPDGKQLLSASEDSLRVWAAPAGAPDYDGRPLGEVRLPGNEIHDIAYNAAGGRVALALAGNQGLNTGGATIWELAGGRPLLELPDYKGHVVAAAFSPDGKRLVTARNFEEHDEGAVHKVFRGDVTVWDAAAGRAERTFDGHHADGRGGVGSLVFHPDGVRVASSGSLPGGPGQRPVVVLVWEATTGKTLLRFPDQLDPAFSPDGKLLATTGQGQVTVWDAATGEKRYQIRAPGDRVMRPAFRADGRCLAAVVDGTVVLWDLESGRMVLNFRETCRPVRGEDLFRNVRVPETFVSATAIAFSPDGQRLAVGLLDGAVKVWELPLGASASGEPFPRVPIGLGSYLNDLAARDYRRGQVLAAGRSSAAEASFASARELWQTMVRDMPENRLFTTNLGRVHRELARYYRENGKGEQAAEAERAAAEVWKQLGGEDGAEDRSPSSLAQHCLTTATEARTRGDLALTRDAYAGAVNVLGPLQKQDPQTPQLRVQLRDAVAGRAMALVDLKNYKEALLDWDQALELAGGADPSLRLGRALTRVRAGDHAGAVAEADALARQNPSPPVRYALARIFARAAARVREDDKIPQAERDKTADGYAARAMELLKAAQAGGAFQDPLFLDRLRRDKDLEAVRGRDDFKQLLDALNGPRGP